MLTRLNVWDMDGCIVDSSHRYRTIEGENRIDLDYWIANEKYTYRDSLLPLASEYQRMLAIPSIYTVIATARIWCEQTQEFVSSKLGQPNAKFARRDRTDTRGGAELKIVGIRKLLNLRQFQSIQEIHIYEDNETYLRKMVDALPNAIGHFHPSKQGH